MPKYKVFLTEESLKCFILDAKDKDEAERIAKAKYDNGEVPIDTLEGGYEWGDTEEIAEWSSNNHL
jgi:hypothetical protein